MRTDKAYMADIHLNNNELVQIEAEGVKLAGNLSVPKNATGVVLFAHGSGSSRLSPRNNFVASVLRNSGLGTLLMDLLTEEEDLDYETRFDISLLSKRLAAATAWLASNEKSRGLKIGYFGASTGAAAAIEASCVVTQEISAIVSRGGRPDLAPEFLQKIKAPTLLIVGGRDNVVIELNRKAYKEINAEKEMVIVPGATHLFDEPGTLEEVAGLASRWFNKYLR